MGFKQDIRAKFELILCTQGVFELILQKHLNQVFFLRKTAGILAFNISYVRSGQLHEQCLISAFDPSLSQSKSLSH